MYTANTMASAIEALGMSLPYSSSTPAADPLKALECRMAGRWAAQAPLLQLCLCSITASCCACGERC
jgi:dihydroxyacid dehydratase/phosphogluconate dehydratase